MVDGTPKLSDYGRTMILNGSLKHNNLLNLIEGNPDTQAVRSFEFGFLVTITTLLSLFINKKCENYIIKHYEQNNFVGYLLQQILAPSVKYICYRKVTGRLNSEIIIKTLPPRVNLRFLASKKIVFYSVLLYVCSYVFHFSFSFLFLLSTLVLFSYLSTKFMLQCF